jgi:hypothetical protein
MRREAGVSSTEADGRREEKRYVRAEMKENVRLRVQALARSARRRTAVYG